MSAHPKLKSGVVGSFVVMALGLPISGAQAFDNEAAKKSFKQCAACHAIGPGAKNRVGPALNGLEDRPYAGIESYKYSKAMRKAADEGKVWNAENLDAFLINPRKHLKGTKMSFKGIKKEAERQNLIAWLFHFDAEGNELSDKADAANANTALLGATAAAMEGDPEYGQYLAGECTTCHSANDGDDGIPAIIGWQKEDFIHALYEYKQEIRANPVMRTVSKRLGDEEMAALAAYFGELDGQ